MISSAEFFNAADPDAALIPPQSPSGKESVVGEELYRLRTTYWRAV
jgi:hypothetical protein